MVRAGVVAHPSEWEVGGYTEMLAGRENISITDYGALMELLNIGSIETLRELRNKWVGDALAHGEMGREGKWTESVAVGGAGFVETIRSKLGLRAKGRRVSGMDDDYTLREPQELFGVKS